MNHKTQKEVEEIALKIYKEFMTAKEATSAECCEHSIRSLDYEIDNLSKNELFLKVVKGLPKVYNEFNPYDLFSLHEWSKKISRADLINSNLSDEESKCFDELSLTDIKRYFSKQLQEYYYSNYNTTKSLHSQILREYYKKNEKGDK